MRDDKNKILNEYEKRMQKLKDRRLRRKERFRKINDNFDDFMDWFYYDEIKGYIAVMALLVVAFYIIDHTDLIGPDKENDAVFWLNFGRYEKAAATCKKNNLKLPSDEKQFYSVELDTDAKSPEYGYWLGNRNIYYPLDNRTKEDDGAMHWYFCIGNGEEE